MEQVDNVLIVGSGLSARAVKDWDTSAWTVIALNNAWRCSPAWNIAFISVRLPQDKHPIPTEGQRIVINRPYWKTIPSAYRKVSGLGSTLFFTSSHWAMDCLWPKVISYIGCDFDYPKEGDNCIYGRGNPDPMRFSSKLLDKWMAHLIKRADQQGVELINFSDGPSRLPFRRKQFSN